MSQTEITQTHLQKFWKLLTFRNLPTNVEDIRVLIQVEMMKNSSCAPICKLKQTHLEKYITSLFVKETTYFCSRSKYLVKDQEVRRVIDLLIAEKLNWYIEITLEGNYYIIASWQHWNM